MKTMIVTTVGAILMMSGGNAPVTPVDIEGQMYAVAQTQEVDTYEEVNNLKEYETIASVVDVENYDLKLVEDNKGKRVTLLVDSKGMPKYKAIYVKHDNYLKLINFNRGMVYKGQLKQEETVTETPVQKEEESHASTQSTPVEQEAPKEVHKEAAPKEVHKEAAPQEVQKQEAAPAPAPKQPAPQSKAEEPVKQTSKDEYGKVSAHIDMSNLTTQVVEDNPGKRITLYKDTNGKVQYKSIYIKHKGFVKIIKSQGGLVYNGSI